MANTVVAVRTYGHVVYVWCRCSVHKSYLAGVVLYKRVPSLESISGTMPLIASISSHLPRLRPFSRSIFTFTPAALGTLTTSGYAVIPSAVPPEICAALRAEIDALASSSALAPNNTHFVPKSGPPLLIPKPHIYELETHLLSPGTLATVPVLADLSHSRALPATVSCFLPRFTLTDHAVKAQVNAGRGACFPLHTDSDAAVDKRILTAILYLNDDWGAEDGGELRILPFPLEEVDVLPMEGTLVLLDAKAMLHRVLPGWKRRYCVTIWMMGTVGQGKEEDGVDGVQLVEVLLRARYRKHVARVALADEWEDSIVEAHGEGVGGQDAVKIAAGEVEKIREVVSGDIGSKFPGIEKNEVLNLLSDCASLRAALVEGAERSGLRWFA